MYLKKLILHLIEEKQILLEAKNLELRKTKISEILTTYSYDNYNNTTVQ